MMGKPRGVLIAGNWKMNHGPAATARFFEALEAKGWRVPGVAGLSACLLVPAVSLQTALAHGPRLGISIGAQNAHWEKSGAFTGELSGTMLRELGIPWVLVGHSERRQYFGETDETVRQRAESLLEQGLQVIACVGETRNERQAGRTQEVLERQLGALFPAQDCPAARSQGLVLAYEPVWAIGTGLTATPGQAQEAHAGIRKFLGRRVGSEVAGRLPILYGGSVTPENAAGLLAGADIDGALVGGASLRPEAFLALVEAGARFLT